MKVRTLATLEVALLALAVRVQAQTPLTLQEAISRAVSTHPAVSAARAGAEEAEAGAREARAGWLPRVDVAGSWDRSTHPIFAFSSLLAQRQFTAADFAIDRLNHPSAVDNVRTLVAAEQPLYDPGLHTSTRTARLRAEAGRINLDVTSHALAVRVAETYAAASRARAEQATVRAALEWAEADLSRARARRDSGLATEADVLAMEVHLADMRARLAAADAAVEASNAALNAATGAPIDAPIVLAAPVSPAEPPPLDALESGALESRPEARKASVEVAIAEANSRGARHAFLPRVAARGGYEVNGRQLGDGASSWAVGAEVQWNLFRGFGDRARVEAADAGLTRARAARDALLRDIRVEVRSAHARLRAALARVEATEAAIAHAREARRIVSDRYDNGLADVTELLRASTALVDAESQYGTARADALLESVRLDRAAGRLLALAP